MKWHNVTKDEFPKDKQEVLLSLDGVNCVATFDKKNKVFRVRQDRESVIPVNKYVFYWTEYKRPGKK